MTFLKTILEYLMHASTWKGIIGILAALGLAFTEAQTEAVVAAALALVGAIQVFIDDHDKDKLADK